MASLTLLFSFDPLWIQDLFSSGQPALGDPAWAGGLDKVTLRGPFHLRRSVPVKWYIPRWGERLRSEKLHSNQKRFLFIRISVYVDLGISENISVKYVTYY